MSRAIYVVVAFKIDREYSVLYAKTEDISEIQKYIEKAFTLANADFISIRRVITNE